MRAKETKKEKKSERDATLYGVLKRKIKIRKPEISK